MSEIFNMLNKCPLFTGIDRPDAERLLVCLGSRQLAYRKGDYIIREGMSIGGLAVLAEGRAVIVQENFWGGRSLLAEITPPQIFAETFACTGSKSTVSVVAQEDCLSVFLDLQRLWTPCSIACSAHRRLTENLIRQLAQKNLGFSEKMTHLAQRTTSDKLLSYLSAMARKNGSSEFDIPLDRQQLADYLLVERSAMCAALSRLRADGLIEYGKSHFILKIKSDIY